MNNVSARPLALFLSPDGKVYPDSAICSGMAPADFGGKPCPHSHDGRFPGIKRLDALVPGYTIDQGKEGDLCPTCAISQLAHVGHWQGHAGATYPEELLPLRLFKCRAGFWLAVPGLRDDKADLISETP